MSRSEFSPGVDGVPCADRSVSTPITTPSIFIAATAPIIPGAIAATKGLCNHHESQVVTGHQSDRGLPPAVSGVVHRHRLQILQHKRGGELEVPSKQGTGA